MVQAWVIKGRLVGSQTVQLDEAVNAHGEVEVIVRASNTSARPAGDSLAAFLRALPAGSKSKSELDRELGRERDAWS